MAKINEKYVNIFRTVLQAVTTAFVIGCFNFLADIHTFIAEQNVKNKKNDEQITELFINYAQTKKQSEENSNDIIYLYAVLPEPIKLKKK
mgnify:FL=1